MINIINYKYLKKLELFNIWENLYLFTWSETQRKTFSDWKTPLKFLLIFTKSSIIEVILLMLASSLMSLFILSPNSLNEINWEVIKPISSLWTAGSVCFMKCWIIRDVPCSIISLRRSDLKEIFIIHEFLIYFLRDI